MNKKLLLIWTFLLCFVMGMSAVEKTAVIKFKDTGKSLDNNSSTTKQEDIVAEGNELIKTFTASGKIFQAQSGYGVKFGNSSNGGNITMTLVNTYKPTKIVANVAGYSATENSFTINGTELTNLAKKPTFTDKEIAYDGKTDVNEITISTTKRGYITSVTIYYEETGGGETPTCATPTIGGTTPFFGSTTVTLGCTTEGAKIYYTLDGNDPTNANALYAEPFTLDKTTTVKAIAYNGETPSSVATKEFVAAPTVTTVAELTALTQGTVFQFSGELTVIAAPSAKHLYVKDAAGNTTLLFDAAGGFAFEVGQHIAAGWQGKVDVYKSLFEVVPTTTLTAVPDVKDEITYDTKTAADVTVENANSVAWLKGVTYTAPADGKKDFEIKEGETTVAGYNQFGIVIDAPAEGRTYDILGVISRYNDNAQFQPLYIDRVPVTANIEVNAETGKDLSVLIADKADGDKVGNLAITLAKGGEYTLSTPIIVAGTLSITGDAEEPATIDASGNGGAFILLNAAPEESLKGTGDYYILKGENAISISNVNIKGVKNQFIYDNNVQYCVENMKVSNCTVTLSSDETATGNGGGAFSFKKGFINTLDIENSTFWNNGTGDVKYFISYNNNGRCSRAGFEKNEVILKNNTFYNLAKTGSFANYSGFNGQKTSAFTVTDNIFVDCGSGQVARRILGSRTASTYTEVTFANNTYMTNVAATEDAEATVAFDDLGGYDVSGTAIEEDPMFKDAANGDFTIGASTRQAYLKTGAPRWLVEFVGEDITAEKAQLQAEIQKAMDLITGKDAETDENVKALSEAINKAKEVYNTAVFKNEVVKAIEDLQAAEEVYQIAVAKKDLNALIETANALIEGKDATDANVVALKTVIEQVTEVAGKADVTLQELKDALVALQAAIDTYKQTTGISGVDAENADNGAWYTLQGVKVNKAQKGIFIHNGKKVVLK